MANLGLSDFKLGLYIKVNVNTWQNKFEVHICYLNLVGLATYSVREPSWYTISS